jgi:hypothetical protein
MESASSGHTFTQELRETRDEYLRVKSRQRLQRALVRSAILSVVTLGILWMAFQKLSSGADSADQRAEQVWMYTAILVVGLWAGVLVWLRKRGSLQR